jgi:hypothetical protein
MFVFLRLYIWEGVRTASGAVAVLLTSSRTATVSVAAVADGQAPPRS